jgi:hypothetical protein
MTIKGRVVVSDIAAILLSTIFSVSLGSQNLPMVDNNTALKALSSNAAPAVLRRGFNTPGDGGGALYHWSSVNCPVPDNGAQVQPNVGVGCWIADISSGPVNAMVWGESYPYTQHISALGSDGGAPGTGTNWCFGTGASACATLKQAYAMTTRIDQRGNNNRVSLDGTLANPLTVQGIFCAGALPGQYSINPANPNAVFLITGAGAGGSAHNTIVDDGGLIAPIVMSTGCMLGLQGTTIQSNSGKYGVFSQNPGTFLGLYQDLVFNGSGGVSAIYAEARSLIELPPVALTIQGTYTHALQANQAYIEFDPEASGNPTFSAGTGLTLTGSFADVANGGNILWFENSTSGTVAGDLATVYGGGNLSIPSSSAMLPGNGVIRSWSGGNIVDGNGNLLFTPTVTACSNGGVVAHNGNSRIQVQFNADNTTGCRVVFGKPPAPATAAFASPPICTVNSVSSDNTSAETLASVVDALGITYIPAAGGTFKAASGTMISCESRAGG